MLKNFSKYISYFLVIMLIAGFTPDSPSGVNLIAQSKKNPSQAAKFAKRGSAKAKKKDFTGALSDYKRAYKLNPTSNYKKRVQQLTSLARKQSSGSKSTKPSSKKAAQAVALARNGNAKAKKKDYVGALKDFQRAYRLNPTSSNRKKGSAANIACKTINIS